MIYQLLPSKTNIGKLKKHKFVINTFVTSDEAEEKLIHKRKNGKHWKFRESFDLDNILENYKYIEESDLSKNNFQLVYKFKKNNLSLQGIVFKIENLNVLYFIPIKKWNRFMRDMSITLYNYFNTYPTKETLPFSELMYERLNNSTWNREGKK